MMATLFNWVMALLAIGIALGANLLIWGEHLDRRKQRKQAEALAQNSATPELSSGEAPTWL